MTALAIAAGLLLLWLVKQVAGMLISQQVKGCIPAYTARKAAAAARLLPSDLAAEYEADWLGELATLDGKPISALRFARGLPRASRSISASLNQRPQREWWLALTRVLDFAGGLVLLWAMAPLLGVIMVFSKASHPGEPVMSRRLRLGMDGEPIFLLSFRTASIQADGTVGISAVGAFLERFSLADLPILLNLLRGDISVVGPPPRTAQPGSSFEEDPLTVRPGLASWQRLAESGAVKLTVSEARVRDTERSWRNDIRVWGIQVLFTVRGNALAGADPNDDGDSAAS
ncbi:MAG: sugar transferase [Solirubrobacterales bacterium]